VTTMAEPGMLKVKLVRSAIGRTQRQRQTLRALGLTHVGKMAIVRDDEATRGRIRSVSHLIEVKN
jgi:large subunit ribosomal protein L30